MSDFRTQQEFRKGSYRKNPYEDPTYLSFAFLFDFYDLEQSPLLAGTAEKFLEDLAGKDEASFYSYRKQDLIAFVKALQHINFETPWVWQSLKGLEKLQAYNPLEPYIGGEEAKIEIETLESLNLQVSGLMHLYKKAVFNEEKWNFNLPANLRKFQMYIYVTEIRPIQVLKKTSVSGFDKEGLKSFPSNFKPKIVVENKNKGIMGAEARPYFLMGIKSCEFDLTSGGLIFSELSKNPESPATNSITINYGKLSKVEARVLNGIIDEVKELTYMQGKLSPAPDSEFFEEETLSPFDYAKEKALGKLGEMKDKAIEGVKALAASKLRELKQKLMDETINRIPSFENVFANVLRKVDQKSTEALNDAVDKKRKNLAANVGANVYGVAPGSTIQQGLNTAAVNNLGNVYGN